MMRTADPGGTSPANGWPGIAWPTTRKLERVVFARAGRFRAAQRIAVHRGAIESRHVERAITSAAKHAAGRVLQRHGLRVQP